MQAGGGAQGSEEMGQHLVSGVWCPFPLHEHRHIQPQCPAHRHTGTTAAHGTGHRPAAWVALLVLEGQASSSRSKALQSPTDRTCFAIKVFQHRRRSHRRGQKACRLGGARGSEDMGQHLLSVALVPARASAHRASSAGKQAQLLLRGRGTCILPQSVSETQRLKAGCIGRRLGQGTASCCSAGC